jgi:hypothetical protein
MAHLRPDLQSICTNKSNFFFIQIHYAESPVANALRTFHSCQEATKTFNKIKERDRLLTDRICSSSIWKEAARIHNKMCATPLNISNARKFSLPILLAINN